MTKTYTHIRCRPRSRYTTDPPCTGGKRSCRDVAPVRSRCQCNRPRRCSGSFSSGRTTVVPVFSCDCVVLPSSCGVFDVSSFSVVVVAADDDDDDDDDVDDLFDVFVGLSSAPVFPSFPFSFSIDLSVAFLFPFAGVFSFSDLSSCVDGGGGGGSACVLWVVGLLVGSGWRVVAAARCICRRWGKAEHRTSSADDRTSVRRSRPRRYTWRRRFLCPRKSRRVDTGDADMRSGGCCTSCRWILEDTSIDDDRLVRRSTVLVTEQPQNRN